MKRMRCFVGALRPPTVAVPLPLLLAGADPAFYLNNGSAVGGGQRALDLVMDYTRFASPFVPATSDLLSLHFRLRALTLNPVSSGPIPVGGIGLILTDRFPDRPGVFGLMFDVGFNSGVADPSFNAVPREGCALFLDAIRDARGGGPQYATEVGFSAVHELGHVFNLWHLRPPVNFMAQSEAAAAFDPSAFFLAQPHVGFLSNVEQSMFVAPGGSGFGVRGALGPPGDSPFNSPTRQENLSLRISARQREFWPFEPVEMDVTLSSRRRTRLPDAVDPGYENFDVWIDTPTGERRRYRPPVRYCANSGVLVLKPGTPFRRDISIFGQSGGYTFRELGVHRVFCTLRVGSSVIRSNVVELSVREPMLRSSRYRRLAANLTAPQAARLLFYKASRRPVAFVAPLMDAARDLGRAPSSANIRYCLGRALTRAAANRPRVARRDQAKVASRVLNAALDSGLLGRPREKRTKQLLESLDE